MEDLDFFSLKFTNCKAVLKMYLLYAKWYLPVLQELLRIISITIQIIVSFMF